MSPGRLFLIFITTTSSLQLDRRAKSPLTTRMEKFLKVEYMEDCDKNVYPTKLSNFTFTRNGSTLIVQGEEIVYRDIKGPLKVQFMIDKCKDKSNPDTCEYYNTWRWDDVCATFNMPFVKLFVRCYTPPYTCPVKKNHYYIKDVKAPAALFLPFLAYSNPNVLWKFQMKKDEGALTVGCTNFGLRIVNIRVRG